MHMVIKNTVGSSQGGFVCCGHTFHEVEWFELHTYMKDTYHIIIGMRHPHLYILFFFFFFGSDCTSPLDKPVGRLC